MWTRREDGDGMDDKDNRIALSLYRTIALSRIGLSRYLRPICLSHYRRNAGDNIEADSQMTR
jgi:hypothetical protein